MLLHSAWASHDWWRWQIPALSQNYRTYAVDIRGHGQSTPLQRVYSVEGFTKDLHIFLNTLAIEKTALVGWSLGGIIAMQYCLDHSSKVNALVLIATQGHKNSRLKLKIIFYYLQAHLSLLMDFAQPRKYDRTSQSFPSQSGEWLERQVKNMLSSKTPKEVCDWIINDIANNPRKNFFEIIKSVWNWEAGDRLKQIKVPSLILVGDRDNLTPSRISQLLHTTIPGSKLIIIKDASHYLVVEHPELVNAEILKFLKSVGY